MACSRAWSSMPAYSRSASRMAADRFSAFLVVISSPVPTAPVCRRRPASYPALVLGVRLRVATLFLARNTEVSGQVVQRRACNASGEERLAAAYSIEG